MTARSKDNHRINSYKKRSVAKSYSSIRKSKHSTTQVRSLPDPNVLLRIINVFIIFDFFAFQKGLPFVVAYLLVIIPLLLYAVTHYIWLLSKEFPTHHLFFGFIGSIDKREKTIYIFIASVFIIAAAIIFTVLFPKIYTSIEIGIANQNPEP